MSYLVPAILRIQRGVAQAIRDIKRDLVLAIQGIQKDLAALEDLKVVVVAPLEVRVLMLAAALLTQVVNAILVT